MRQLVIEEPNEKQKLFLKDTHKHIGYGGARGGGKSWAIRTKMILLALAWPGIRILIVRRTYEDLRKNHVEPLRAQLLGIARYNKTDKQMVFPNGSVVDFGYCDNDSDALHYQGVEYDVIFIDEATQMKEDWLKKIQASCRGVNKYPKRVYYTCNPGGVGHAYIKRIFIDRAFRDKERPEDYHFIQAKVQDNKVLMDADPEYVNMLESLPTQLRAMWLDGRWDVFAGQFFEEFRDDPEHYGDRRFTHVIEPFDIPREWKIYRSYDFGFGKPFSCAWWAVDHDGVLYRILELYGCMKDESGEDMANEGLKWSPDRQFAEIARIEREHRWLRGKQINGVADPSIWDASRGESINETALRHHLYFQKGDNRRIAGWMQVHYRLSFDEEGYPQMYIFNNCKAFIRTIPLLQYDKNNAEDLDTAMEDHCLRGDTLVWTESGRKRIDEMVGTEGKVLSHDGQYHKYTDCRKTQEKVDVFRVELSDGSFVDATANHRFMLKNGEWKRLDELKEGDELWDMSK